MANPQDAKGQASHSATRDDESGAASRAALPIAGSLHEREAELSQIDGCLYRALEGVGGSLLICGPAGIGKTTLVSAATAKARELGMDVFTARGAEMLMPFAFGSVRELFDARVLRLGESEREQVLAGAASLAAEALGLRGADAGAHNPPSEPFVAEHGLYWLVSNLAEARPLLIALDDAQWADLPSLRFLSYLVQRLGDLPVSVVVATRPDVNDARVQLMAALSEAARCEPSSLSEAAVRTILEQRLSRPVDEEFATASHRATAGNPFLTSELVQQISATGLAPVRVSAGALPELRSESIARSVAVRLAHLPDDARRLAQALAVLGSGTELHRVASVAGLTMLTAPSAADALAESDLLTSSRPPAYVHPLLESAVREGMSLAERGRMHAEAVRVLSEQSADPTMIAAHLLHVEPGPDAAACVILQHAARAASARGAPLSAAGFLRRALREPLPAADAGEVMADLGQALLAGADPAGLEELERSLQLLARPRRRAAVNLALGIGRYERGDLAGARQALGDGLQEPLDPQDELRISLRAAELTVARSAPADERRERAADLRDLLVSGGSGRTSVERLLLAQMAFETMQQGTAAHESVVELALRALPPQELDRLDAYDALVLPLAGMALYFSDQYEVVEAAFTAEIRRARLQGSMLAYATASFFRGVPRYLSGQLVAAMDDWQSALDVAEHGWAFALPSARALYALCALEREDPQTAAPLLELPGGDEAWSQHPTFPYVLAVRGHYAIVADGDPARALELLLAAGQRQRDLGATNPSTLHWQTEAALAAHALGQGDVARAHADEALRRALDYGAPRAIGIARRAAGLVHGGRYGHDQLELAARTLEPAGAQLELARALADLGAALRRDGQRAESRGPLMKALDLAERCGGLALRRRISDELRLSGARPRRALLSGADSLTSGERRVALLAAQGHTNRQIAQQLFVTLRTVETHLTHIYAKLAITSRRDLAGTLEAARDDLEA